MRAFLDATVRLVVAALAVAIVFNVISLAAHLQRDTFPAPSPELCRNFAHDPTVPSFGHACRTQSSAFTFASDRQSTEAPSAGWVTAVPASPGTAALVQEARR